MKSIHLSEEVDPQSVGWQIDGAKVESVHASAARSAKSEPGSFIHRFLPEFMKRVT
jgi:hypothetical protein